MGWGILSTPVSKSYNPGILQYSETFYRNIRAKFGPSLQILAKTQTGAFQDFWSILYKGKLITPEPVMILT